MWSRTTEKGRRYLKSICKTNLNSNIDIQITTKKTLWKGLYSWFRISRLLSMKQQQQKSTWTVTCCLMCDTSQRIVFLDKEQFYFWPFFLFTRLTGVYFLQPFDKCIFKIAVWQLMIKAVNYLSHPHTHYVTIRSTKSEGPGCEQTGGEDKAFGAIWLLSACSTSSGLMGSFVV